MEQDLVYVEDAALSQTCVLPKNCRLKSIETVS